MSSARSLYLILLSVFLFLTSLKAIDISSVESQYEIVIVGGGTSGTAAAIQSARLDKKVLLIEEGPWLGGMLSSAGVSAIDGNHRIASGLFAEFREHIYKYYGGPSKVETGWVSNTLFEPNVADSIFKAMADLPNLDILYNSRCTDLVYENEAWSLQIKQLETDAHFEISAQLLIDATELGDILAKVGVPYDLGMDDPIDAEPWAPGKNDIIQDLTWVALLEDKGLGSDHTIKKPQDYDPKEFACSCKNRFNPEGMEPQQLLDYAKLPNGKYLLNWPNCGNDAYLNTIELDANERLKQLDEAKKQTLRFVYFIQNELGFKHLALAKEVFPTGNGLALMPYHRESRRAQNIVRLNVRDLSHPFQTERPLYRTGIAVGDYPIDHHHKKNKEAPVIEFIDIKVPSYSVPLGTMIPKEIPNFIVAEKSISVTNIVNGTTRLQPVVMGIGQAAGALAALAIEEEVSPIQVSVREVQHALLKAHAAILPYIDVPITDADFKAIQRVGAMGWLRGSGISYKWANQTWFYPDDFSKKNILFKHLAETFHQLDLKSAPDGSIVDLPWLTELMQKINPKITYQQVELWALQHFSDSNSLPNRLTRRNVAILLDHFLNPFQFEIDHYGRFKHESKEVSE